MSSPSLLVGSALTPKQDMGTGSPTVIYVTVKEAVEYGCDQNYYLVSCSNPRSNPRDTTHTYQNVKGIPLRGQWSRPWRLWSGSSWWPWSH